jgi:RNA polymerase sigma factor (TIGR02999 family)
MCKLAGNRLTSRKKTAGVHGACPYAARMMSAQPIDERYKWAYPWGWAVSKTTSQPVSELLAKWQAGEEGAFRLLVPVVYDELRRLAHNHLRRERPDHTLESGALVHEAYLRLAEQSQVHFQDRVHFFAVSARLMRQILVQYARRRSAAKRDGGHRIVLDDGVALTTMRKTDLLALDDALNELARLDPLQSRIVEMRFFGGLSIEETAEALKISPATVKREWATARLWLHHEMRGR